MLPRNEKHFQLRVGDALFLVRREICAAEGAEHALRDWLAPRSNRRVHVQIMRTPIGNSLRLMSFCKDLNVLRVGPNARQLARRKSTKLSKSAKTLHEGLSTFHKLAHLGQTHFCDFLLVRTRSSRFVL